MIVVLPLPVAPRSATVCPGLASNETRLSTGSPPLK